MWMKKSYCTKYDIIIVTVNETMIDVKTTSVQKQHHSH